jgi:alpha-beta hydrolase superfamily lysophospholipase
VDSATLAAETLARDGVINSFDGTSLFYRAWPRPNAKVTFAVVHGLGDHSGRYVAFADAMARRGMATYAVDLRGHGMSAGQRGHVDSWSQWTEDVAAFVHHVEGSTTGEVVPLGHSFGGAAMLSTVLAGKLDHSKRFVVSSPALKLKVAVPQWRLSFAEAASRVMPRFAQSNQVDAGMLSRIPEVATAYRSDPLVHSKISGRMFTEWHHATKEILVRAGAIKIPFLILAGTADRLIDPAGSEELHRRAPAVSELHLLEGRYHEPFNDLGNEDVFSIIATWLAGS